MPASPESRNSGRPTWQERAEERLQALLEVFGQINFELDFEGNRVEWEGSEALGYDPHLSGQTIEDWTDLVHPEDRPRFEVQLATAQVEIQAIYLELRFRLINGSYRWYQMRGVPRLGQDGRLGKLIGVLDDMTERRPSAHLAAERDSLARTNNELQEFAYVASHDLQEPLRTITAFVELLNEDHRTSLDAEAQEYLDFIGEGATRLQTLINDLLAYSRMTADTEDVAAVSLTEIVQEALENLFASLEESQAKVDLAPLPTVRGERTRLLVLFQNLIGNALKFRHPDRQPEIRIAAKNEGATYRITVADNGIGIPFEQHENIFNIFLRLHAPRAYEGNGMGLAICKKIVERHGGLIWVESVPGEGSQFHFTLRQGQRAR